MAITKFEDLPPLPGEEVTEVKEARQDGVVRTPVPLALVESDIEIAMEREALRHSRESRGEAYRLYMTGKSPSEVVAVLANEKITLDSVIRWAKDGDWAMRLRRMNDAREQVVRESVRSVRLSKVETAVEASLRISEKVRQRAEEMLDDGDLTPMGLKNVADAAKASGDFEAHGMGESVQQAGEAGRERGKTPLVIIYPSGGLPPAPKEADVIEVRGE